MGTLLVLAVLVGAPRASGADRERRVVETLRDAAVALALLAHSAPDDAAAFPAYDALESIILTLEESAAPAAALDALLQVASYNVGDHNGEVLSCSLQNVGLRVPGAAARMRQAAHSCSTRAREPERDCTASAGWSAFLHGLAKGLKTGRHCSDNEK